MFAFIALVQESSFISSQQLVCPTELKKYEKHIDGYMSMHACSLDLTPQILPSSLKLLQLWDNYGLQRTSSLLF